MIRFYSLFVTDDELLASPYVRRFNPFHDINLHRGQSETVNFLLQTTLSPEQYEQMNLLFDPHSISVTDVDIKTFKHQTLLTVHLTPKEIGSLKIGVAFPQSPNLHRAHLKKIASPFLSIPCREFMHENAEQNSEQSEPVSDETHHEHQVLV